MKSKSLNSDRHLRLVTDPYADVERWFSGYGLACPPVPAAARAALRRVPGGVATGPLDGLPGLGHSAWNVGPRELIEDLDRPFVGLHVFHLDSNFVRVTYVASFGPVDVYVRHDAGLTGVDNPSFNQTFRIVSSVFAKIADLGLDRVVDWAIRLRLVPDLPNGLPLTCWIDRSVPFTDGHHPETLERADRFVDEIGQVLDAMCEEATPKR